MIAPEIAGKLLEEVIVERVTSFVHVPELVAFEQQLWFTLLELGVAKPSDVARQMVDRAIASVMQTRAEGLRCELCEEEARDELASKRGRK